MASGCWTARRGLVGCCISTRYAITAGSALPPRGGVAGGKPYCRPTMSAAATTTHAALAYGGYGFQCGRIGRTGNEAIGIFGQSIYIDPAEKPGVS